jgi:hypothetical protein
MGVVYSSPDSLFTRLAAVYRCRCGARSARYGRLAALLPRGWLRLDDEECICEHCAEYKRAAEAR